MHTRKLSVRLGFLVLMFMSMLILFYYRAAMNAFLNVKVFRVPINSHEDIIDTDMDLVVKKGVYTEQVFMFAQEGSLFQAIFDKKLKGTKRFHELGNNDDAVLDIVKRNKAIYLHDLFAIVDREDYPCGILDVKALR